METVDINLKRNNMCKSSVPEYRAMIRVFLTLLVVVSYSRAQYDVCLQVPQETSQCVTASSYHPISTPGTYISCIHDVIWKYRTKENLTDSDLEYFEKVSDKLSSDPDPRSGFRRRREYRQLEAGERERLHRALQILYEEGTVDRYGRLYRAAYPTVHGGPAYLGFHRLYLLLFEEELRRIDDTVSLPYWDFTLDSEMDNPVNSVIWSPALFGNGNGEVVTGSAAGWKTPLGTLRRNYGVSNYGRLMNRETIYKIMTKCRIRDISYPVTNEEDEDFVLEYHINGVLNWVGGSVSNKQTSAYDPVFLMVQAFADYVWESFRYRQQMYCNIDPVNDFTTNIALPGQRLNDKFIGLVKLTNKVALSSSWTTQWYGYTTAPSCPNCASAWLWCNFRINQCVSHSRRRDFNVGRHMNIHVLNPFEPEANYVAKMDDDSAQPSPFNDGRTRATAKRDAVRAVSAERERLAAAEAARRRSLFQTSGGQDFQPPFTREFRFF